MMRSAGCLLLCLVAAAGCTEAPEAKSAASSEPEDVWLAAPQTGDLDFDPTPPHGVVELNVRDERQAPVAAVALLIDEIVVPWSTVGGDPLFIAIPEGEHLLEMSVWEDEAGAPRRVAQYFAAARGCRLSVDVVALDGDSGAHVEQRLSCLYANPVHAIPSPRAIPARPAPAERSAASRWAGERQRQVADSVMYVALALASARDERIPDIVACLDPKLRSLQEIHVRIRSQRDLAQTELPALPQDLARIQELAERSADVHQAARRCL
jgi:hypothetical protein